MTGRLSVAVVVCTSSRRREPLLRACVSSLLAGERVPDEILVVVDHNPALSDALARSLPAPVRLLRTERQGLSEARNVGIEAVRSEVVAFLDDDATADIRWLQSLMDVFETRPEVLGVGGPAVPRWGAERRWVPDELLWVVGCTYRGHREDAGPIRNPIGCNMAFRRGELIAAGSFSTSFGKRGDALETCDETELSLRLARVHGPGRIRYVPGARALHFVPASRVSWRLLVRRSLSEGLAKARLRRLYGRPAMGPERSYVRSLVLESVPRLLVGGIVRRDRYSVLGAVAVLLSVLITAAAFVAGAVAPRREMRPREPAGVHDA